MTPSRERSLHELRGMHAPELRIHRVGEAVMTAFGVTGALFGAYEVVTSIESDHIRDGIVWLGVTVVSAWATIKSVVGFHDAGTVHDERVAILAAGQTETLKLDLGSES